MFYLNDDFEGGHTQFRVGGGKDGIFDVKPKTGKLVFFSSGSEHVHGVKKITRGERYTLATWFTRDKNYAMI